jgi:hypothetical protein
LAAVGIRKESLELVDLGKVVDPDVGMGGVPGQEVLVVALSRIEGLAALDLRDDGAVEDMRLVELRDVGLRDLGLLRARGEDGRAVLGAGIGALTVELSGIVRDREEDLKQPAVADHPRIERHLH